MASREDWRSVPLESNPAGHAQQSEYGSDMEWQEMDGLDDEDSGSDEYMFENGRLNEESDEDYVEGEGPSRTAAVKSPRKRAHTSSSPPISNDAPKKITSRQTLECRRAFALFFPDVDVDSDELNKKKIMAEDISRVAKLLNEKIKAEEVVEMLEAFSSSNDKSMNLRDFERMMITAKMA